MQYNRSRSRQHANNYLTLKFGDVADTTGNTVQIFGPNEGKSSGAAPDVDYVSAPIGMNASGVTTFSNSGRIWFTPASILTRSQSYEGSIVSALLPGWRDQRMAMLSGLSAPYLVLEGSETINDVVTTDFKEIRAKGGIVSSPMTSFSYIAECSALHGGQGFSTPIVTWTDRGRGSYSGGQYYRARHDLSVTFGAHFKAFGVPAEVLQLLRSDMNMSYIDGSNAISESHSRVYEAEADLALFIAEANKTLSSLAIVAGRLAMIVKKIKRGQFLDIAPNVYKRWKASKAQGIATGSNIFLDAWLEARYLWRPLILDAQDAIKYLNKTSSNLRRTFRAFEGDAVESLDYTFDTTHAGFSYHFYGTHVSDKSVRAGLLTQIDPGFGEGKELGFLNPAGLIWELIPYSFVVDWFVNVSGFIAASNPSNWFKILTSWASYTSEVSFTGFVDITNLTTSDTITVPFRLLQKQRKRDINTEPSSINFDVNLDIYKLVDGVALLRRFKH